MQNIFVRFFLVFLMTGLVGCVAESEPEDNKTAEPIDNDPPKQNSGQDSSSNGIKAPNNDDQNKTTDPTGDSRSGIVANDDNYKLSLMSQTDKVGFIPQVLPLDGESVAGIEIATLKDGTVVHVWWDNSEKKYKFRSLGADGSVIVDKKDLNVDSALDLPPIMKPKVTAKVTFDINLDASQANNRESSNINPDTDSVGTGDHLLALVDPENHKYHAPSDFSTTLAILDSVRDEYRLIANFYKRDVVTTMNSDADYDGDGNSDKYTSWIVQFLVDKYDEVSGEYEPAARQATRNPTDGSAVSDGEFAGQIFELRFDQNGLLAEVREPDDPRWPTGLDDTANPNEALDSWAPVFERAVMSWVIDTSSDTGSVLLGTLDLESGNTQIELDFSRMTQFAGGMNLRGAFSNNVSLESNFSKIVPMDDGSWLFNHALYSANGDFIKGYGAHGVSIDRLTDGNYLITEGEQFTVVDSEGEKIQFVDDISTLEVATTNKATDKVVYELTLNANATNNVDSDMNNPDRDSVGTGENLYRLVNPENESLYASLPDYDTYVMVYDSLGEQHSLTSKFYKRDTVTAENSDADYDGDGTNDSYISWIVQFTIYDFSGSTGLYQATARQALRDPTDGYAVSDGEFAGQVFELRFNTSGELVEVREPDDPQSPTGLDDTANPNEPLYVWIPSGKMARMSWVIDSPLNGANSILGSENPKTDNVEIVADFSLMGLAPDLYGHARISQNAIILSDEIPDEVFGHLGRIDPVDQGSGVVSVGTLKEVFLKEGDVYSYYEISAMQSTYEIKLNNESGIHQNPVLFHFSSGSKVVLWLESSKQSSEQKIWLQKLDKKGQKLGDNQLLQTFNADDERFAAAVSGDRLFLGWFNEGSPSSLTGAENNQSNGYHLEQFVLNTGLSSSEALIANSTQTNSSFELNVLKNDSNPDQRVVSITNPPVQSKKGAILTYQGEGVFLYQPATDFTGTDEFTYEINDGENTSTATVSIEVN